MFSVNFIKTFIQTNHIPPLFYNSVNQCVAKPPNQFLNERNYLFGCFILIQVQILTYSIAAYCVLNMLSNLPLLVEICYCRYFFFFFPIFFSYTYTYLVLVQLRLYIILTVSKFSASRSSTSVCLYSRQYVASIMKELNDINICNSTNVT